MSLRALAKQSIRKACFPDDLSFVAALWRSYGDELRAMGVGDLGGETVEPDIALLERSEGWDHWHIYLAFVDDVPAGTAALTPLPHLGADVAEGRRLYVAPAARGRGLARQLLQIGEEDARCLGFTTLHLDTFHGSAGAAPFALYSSLGFHECAPYNDYPPERVRFLKKELR